MRHMLALFAVLLFALPAHAGMAESENAVTAILFDENMENASYSLREDGFVDILFGPAVDEKIYIHIVERMRKHPDIPGVLSGRGKANFCPIP